MRPQPVQHFDQGIARSLDAQNVFELARGNQNAAGSDESGDNRMGQEVRQKPQPEEAEDQQEGPREKCQCQGGGDIVDALITQLADGRRRHQRHHGHRPHRQCARGAENGVEHDGQDGGIDPGLGRQTGQQGIGQRLRDQHDRHDDRCDQIAAQLLAIIPAAPVEDRQVSGQLRSLLRRGGQGNDFQKWGQGVRRMGAQERCGWLTCIRLRQPRPDRACRASLRRGGYCAYRVAGGESCHRSGPCRSGLYQFLCTNIFLHTNIQYVEYNERLEARR